MKGFSYTFRGRKQNLNPCFFCKHRGKPSYEYECYNCISNEDVALHHSNANTEFAFFEALSEAHLKVLILEQKGTVSNESTN